MRRGYKAQIQLQDPITAGFIERNKRLGKWINENAIIRLYGIMNHCGFLSEIDQSLSGWREIDLMRRMRNAFTKTRLNYRPEDPDNIRLREAVIGHFGLKKEDFPEEEIPTPIDTVVEPIFKRCREYIIAKCAAHIGIGRSLTAPPSHTTQHTGPYCAVRLIRQVQIQGNESPSDSK